MLRVLARSRKKGGGLFLSAQWSKERTSRRRLFSNRRRKGLKGARLNIQHIISACAEGLIALKNPVFLGIEQA
jgi:hypothetical protein